MVSLDHPLATAFFYGVVAARLFSASWLVIPESAPNVFPDLNPEGAGMVVERFIHWSNMVLYLFLIVHHAGTPKEWKDRNFGWLLVLLFVHHFGEQMMHEIGGFKTNLDLLKENAIWTTVTIILVHAYLFKHGYYNTYYRIAAYPFPVFLALVLEMFETHAGSATDWTLGNPVRDDEDRTGYLASDKGFPLTVRVIMFLCINAFLGFVVKEYLKIHAQAVKKAGKTA